MTNIGQKMKKKLQFGIIQSILLGFFLLFLIMLIVTGIDISALSQFSKHFKTYQKASELAQTMITIDKTVSELQRQILAFSNTEKSTNPEQLTKLHRQLLQDLHQLQLNDSATNGAHPEQLHHIMNAVTGLKENLENLQTQRQFRDTIIHQDLELIYTELSQQVDKSFQLAKKSNNGFIIEELWETRNYQTQAQLLSARYFSKHESLVKTKVISTLALAEEHLKTLHTLAGSTEVKDQLSLNIKKLTQAKTLFVQAVQADRNYLFLINVVLAGETAEISTLSDNLRIEYLARLQKLVVASDQQISFIKNISIFSSVFGALFAIAIAIRISDKIRKPLLSITDTFSRLAKGEHLTEIPGTARFDEIGKLANAANIFYQTNIRTQQLLVQAEEFSVKLQQREQDLKEAVQKAESANLAKSQFLANMSHELRTPMNAILGMLSLMHKTELSAKQTDYLLKTVGAAKLLLCILNDILDLTKAEAGKMELNLVDFNLDHLLHDVSDILSSYTADKPVELLFEINDNVPRYLFGDPLRLQQILINLGGNAIKFTQQGQVIISILQHEMSAESVHLTFSVKDTGIGIAPEHQEKIFSVFTQAEGSITRRFGGTGLGLAISKSLVEMMGGHLSLQSKLGSGSIFSFSIDMKLLPAAQIQKMELQHEFELTQKDLTQLQSLHILLVEDNRINQQIAVELLEAEGAKVSVAENGQEAISFLQNNLREHKAAGVDLVLMDLQMPVMDGLTATKIIRTELKLFTLPIIAITANSMISDREACLQAGMNDHIGKPFNLQRLTSIICNHIGRVHKEPTQPDPQPRVAATPRSHTPHSEQPQADIDFLGAVARMGGNQSLFLQILPQFREHLGQLPTRLNDLLSNGDITTITRELHSFKGLSATMGANTLSKEIANIEKILKHDPQHPDTAHLVTIACELIAHSIVGFDALAANLSAENDRQQVALSTKNP